jgi:UDP-3-O-acyl N-acetylglucosamine deacetylase
MPAPVDSGVRFRRADLPGKPEIRATVANVVDTRRRTMIADGKAEVHTVEHLLAAANALGLDNLMVEMTGAEPPVGDGSATPFVSLLTAAGAISQNAPRRFLEVKTPLYVEAGETRLVIVPDTRFRISCVVKYNSTPLDCQYLSLEINEETFVRELAQARTFCLFHEIEALIKGNLICGGSLDNAVVIKGEAILSKDGLRYPDEFVRHKIMDMVGDLFLLGCRIRGHVIAVKPGHPTNVELARRIACQQEEGSAA